MPDTASEQELSVVHARIAIGNVVAALDEIWRLAAKYPEDQSLHALRHDLLRQASHKDAFNHIYRSNVWETGSGAGSSAEFTGPYHDFLAGFIRDHAIRTVVDAGCGDWQSTQFMDWTGVDYLGVDVSSVVLENTRRFAKDNIRFEEMDVRRGLPEADLLIMKDVLQHWSNGDIIAFLPNLRRFRFCLLTNDCEVAGMPVNSDIAAGERRGIDLSRPPFNIRGTWVGRTPTGDGDKRIFLVQSARKKP